MKEIVILGGGFGGVSAALTLLKNLELDVAEITLIDKNSYHLFKASLYEVATSEQPKKNIAIPYKEIFNDSIKLLEGEVDTIDTENRLVSLKNEAKYSYDYLIIALGSEPAFYEIQGLKEHALTLRWLEDAVKIREEIEAVFHKKVHNGEEMNIVVGGGGFSGTELTAELVNYKEKLSKHHKTKKYLIKITVIQGSEGLLKELDEKVSRLAQKRLEKNGVKLVFGTHIQKVSQNVLETDNNGKFAYDVLIWTGGVKASPILETSGFKVNGRGQASVDKNLLVNGFTNVFAIGDLAEFADPATNKPAVWVAQVAEDEGKIAAENIYRHINGKELVAYDYKHSGYVVPLKGKFAVVDLGKFRIVGFLGWIIQQIVVLRYLLRILPLSKALMRWNKFEMYLMGNS